MKPEEWDELEYMLKTIIAEQTEPPCPKCGSKNRGAKLDVRTCNDCKTSWNLGHPKVGDLIATNKRLSTALLDVINTFEKRDKAIITEERLEAWKSALNPVALLLCALLFAAFMAGCKTRCVQCENKDTTIRWMEEIIFEN